MESFESNGKAKGARPLNSVDVHSTREQLRVKYEANWLTKIEEPFRRAYLVFGELGRHWEACGEVRRLREMGNIERAMCGHVHQGLTVPVVVKESTPHKGQSGADYYSGPHPFANRQGRFPQRGSSTRSLYAYTQFHEA